MLVTFIVVGQDVVDGLKQGSQGPAVVLLLEQELLFGENLDEVHETITSFSAESLGVWRQVGDDGHDALVDWLEESWT